MPGDSKEEDQSNRRPKRQLEFSSTKKDPEEKKSKSKPDSESDIGISVAMINNMEDTVREMQQGASAVPRPILDPMMISEVFLNEVRNSVKPLMPEDPADPSHRMIDTMTMAMTRVMIKVFHECTMPIIDEMREATAAMKASSGSSGQAPAGPDPALVSIIRSQRYEIDALQQYSRRESLRIHGIPVDMNETVEQTEEKARKVFADIGVTVSENDVHVAHRAGKMKGNTQPILVKFISRRKRNDVMRKKSSLKTKPNYRGIFVTDDLTPLRQRLLGYIKGLPTVNKVWSIDGKIKVEMKEKVNPTDHSKVYNIESPDDLFKLGETMVDFARPSFA